MVRIQKTHIILTHLLYKIEFVIKQTFFFFLGLDDSFCTILDKTEDDDNDDE